MGATVNSSRKVRISALAPGQAFTTAITGRRGKITSAAEFSEAVYVAFDDNGERLGLHRNVIVYEVMH